MTTGEGANVGVAKGAIEIDLKQLEAARNAVVRAARDMDSAMIRMGASADQSSNRVARSWNSLKSTISQNQLAIDGFFAALTIGGVKSANSLRRLDATFKTLAGSQENANKLTAELRQLAEDTGKPFLDLKEAAVSFIPAIKGTNVSLNETLMIAERLRLKDPTARIKDSVVAINELLSGSAVSLARRFEIPAKIANEIANMAEKDPAAAMAMLSTYLDQLGLTNEALMEMGKTGADAFGVLQSEAKETTAAALDPLSKSINKVALAFTDVLREVRNLNPELLKVTGTLAGIYGLSRLPSLAGMIPGVGKMPGASAIGKAGVLGAAAYGGIKLGGEAVKGAANIGLFQNMNGENALERFKGKSNQQILNEVGDTFIQGLKILAYGVTEIGQQFTTGFFYLINIIKGVSAGLDWVFANLINVIADVVRLFGQLLVKIGGIELPFGIGQVSGEMVTAGENIQNFGNDLKTSDEKMKELVDTALKNPFELTAAQQGVINGFTSIQKVIMGVKDDLGEQSVVTQAATGALGYFYKKLGELPKALDIIVPKKQGEFSPEIAAAWGTFQGDLADIEAQRLDERKQVAEDYEQSRLDMETSYQKELTQDVEDEALRRQRAEQQVADKIADIRAKLSETETTEEKQHAEKLAELQTSYQQTERNNEAAHLRDMETLARDHRDRLMDAAGRLDAKAVIAEQRSYQRATSDKESSYQIERTQRQREYVERLADENIAHEQRLQAARDNATKQIEELQANFAQDEQLRAQDRQRDLARQTVEHTEDMQRLKTEHLQRLGEIDTQAAKEANKRQQAFIAEYNSLITNQNTRLGIQNAGQAAALISFQNWWKQMNSVMNNYKIPSLKDYQDQTGVTGQDTYGGYRGMQVGGTVGYTGLHNLENGEGVIPAGTWGWMKRALGGNVTQPALASAMGGGGMSVSVQLNTTIEGGQAAPLENLEKQIEWIAEQHIIKRIENWMQRRGRR